MSAPPLTGQGRKLLAALLVAGVVGRLVVAFSTYGLRFDINSFVLLDDELRMHGLHVYDHVNFPRLFLWPYPGGYFPWILAAGAISRDTGLAFHALVHLPAILADAGTAWLVQFGLGRSGHSERIRLAGAALVMAGPVFFVISGYHGQIDAVAFLPAIAAVLLWSAPRAGPDVRRALAAGALIGLGAAIKSVPLVVVLALLPTARTWRERGALVGGALLVPALALAPFAIADLHAVRLLLGYHGAPGAGGVSLLVQPNLAHFWITSYWHTPPVALMPSAATRFLIAHGGLLTGAGLLLVGAVALWRRLEPVPAATLLFLGFYAFGTGFFVQYLLWGLPFLLLYGRLREVAAVQLLMIVPMVLFYFGPHGHVASEIVYAGFMLIVWATLAASFVRTLATTLRSSDARAPGSRPRPVRPAAR